MWRQGDILFMKETRPLGKTTPKGSNIILHGEATGHSHKVEGAGQIVLSEGTEDQFLVANDNVRIVHEEHHTIELPEGVYRIRRQREFDGEAIRYVHD
jgi:hypothetical protein